METSPPPTLVSSGGNCSPGMVGLRTDDGTAMRTIGDLELEGLETRQNFEAKRAEGGIVQRMNELIVDSEASIGDLRRSRRALVPP